MDDKLAEFKADVRQAQDDAAAKAVTRVQLEKPYAYKKKAHEEQARFNDQVSACIREAQEGIATHDETPAQKLAQEALEKGARLLAERQKLIKIADRSENGWGVVAEYTADELADDSDDEKRLEKAEKAAEKKAGLRKRKRAQQQQQQPKFPRFPTREKASPYNYTFPPPALQWKPQQALPVGPGVGARHTPQASPRAVGPCFACGEMGHLRTYCPKIQTQERKWYPCSLHECAVVDVVNDVCDVCIVPVKSSVDVKCGDGRCEDGMQRDVRKEVLARKAPLTPSHGVSSVPVHFVTSDCGRVLEDAAMIAPESLTTMWEVESLKPDTLPEAVYEEVIVKGRLKKHIPFWREKIKAPDTILSTIESGYVLPLKTQPTPFSKANHIY